MIWIQLTEDDILTARRIGETRLNDLSRHHSADFAPSMNPTGQTRGAVGEIAVMRWLQGHGFDVSDGFVEDNIADTDITVNGIRLEVMTTRLSDRVKTGTCVPPNKWRAHRRRGAWGYVFPATDGDDFHAVCIQSVCRIDDVALDQPIETSVGSSKRVNFVIRPEFLEDPEMLVKFLMNGEEF